MASHESSSKKKRHCKGEKDDDVQKPPFDEVDAFPVLTEITNRNTPSAVDLGLGDVTDNTYGTRVSDTLTGTVYMSFSSTLGNIKIWKVTEGRFMFSGDDGNKFITAYLWNGNWYPLWMPGSDPVGVTEANMSSDSRVWQIHPKFSNFFIRLEMQKELYLNSDTDAGRLKILDVGDPENTRDVTPLQVTVV